MSRTGWFIANLLLAAAAALATRAILRPQTAPDAGAAGQRQTAFGTTQRAAPVPVKTTEPESHSALVTAVLGETDTLWKDSLFRPDRTEDLVTDKAAPSAAPNASVQFELIGVGVIADKSAAIILVKSNRPRVASRTSRGSRAAPSPAPERKRHVYKLGDEIADTGYVLKEIKLTEVTVVRGDEKQVLKLERGDASSKKRKEEAARDEALRKRKAAATAKSAVRKTKTPATPGMPPPPPPPPPAAMPGGPG
ncbi:MAG: hypothetical protein GXP31_03680, partial [Kiritimatiellaeota bacterium]|nr:hypothetical protein [Kiritimatiellota bacterium]